MTTVFKALSDDTRRQILKLLADGDMTAKDISEHFTNIQTCHFQAFRYIERSKPGDQRTHRYVCHLFS